MAITLTFEMLVASHNFHAQIQQFAFVSFRCTCYWNNARKPMRDNSFWLTNGFEGSTFYLPKRAAT